MLPKRFVESSCLKCHHEVTDVPQAKKLQAGYQRIVKYGCTGCHTIGGEGSFGPDLTDEPAVGPEPLARRVRRSRRSGSSSGSSTRTPSGPTRGCPGSTALTNNADKEDWPKNYAEANAIAHYLFTKSTEPAGFVDPPAKTDPAKGKELFLQKGCMACHQHRPYQSRTSSSRPTGSPSTPPTSWTPPRPTIPRTSRPRSATTPLANFGPNLSNIAAKFQSQAAGPEVAGELDPRPGEVSSQEPDAQPPALVRRTRPTSRAGSSRSRASGRSTSRSPGDESTEVKDAVDELVKLYVTKSGSFKHADGKTESVTP